MLDGAPSTETMTEFAPPRVEVKVPQNNFTPLPEFGNRKTTEPPKFKEPTTTPQIDQLMADILTQGKDHNPQAAVKQVEKNLPQETKLKLYWMKHLKLVVEKISRYILKPRRLQN